MLGLLAAIVFLQGPARPVNRRLALLLSVIATVLVSGVGGVAPLLSTAAGRFGLYSVHSVAEAALPPLYLLFLARALDTRLTRSLRRPVVERTLWAMAALLPVVMVVLIDRFDEPAWYTTPVPAPHVDLRLVGLYVYASLGFVATMTIAVHALVTAVGAAARRRARTYVAAFGMLDVSWGLLYLWAAAYFTGNPVTVTAWFGYLFPGAALLFAVLLSHAILRTQLFDIDLKLKWTVRQGTIVAFFLAAFFVVSELAAQVLAPRLGTVSGILAAGALLFFLAPLQRLAERVSDRAMPGVRDTEEYRTVRKREVYQAAVESAMRDGRITDRERDVLATLADQLGLTHRDVGEIERAASTRGHA